MVDGTGFSGISPKDLYNKVSGNKAEFVKQWQAEYNDNGNPFMADRIYNYIASMDTDGTPGLTPEEYKQGLSDKKALAEIKLDKIHSQYVPEDKLEDFAKMTQEEKLAYLTSKIPHEAGHEAEARIQASIVLSSINRLDTEIGLIEQELDVIKTQEEIEKSTQEDKQNEIKSDINNFKGLG